VAQADAETIIMINRYSDHAANERTFLAWVRTAIAIMAFGFVIEKFDLFLKALAPQATLKLIAPHGQKFANAAGLAFIAIGVVMIVLAGIRFAATTKAIDAEETRPSPGERLDLALAALIGLLGISLFLYMASAVLPTV
jgi:inner membrane protein YidH